MSDFQISIETIEWILLGLSPLLAVGTARWLYNSYRISAERERRKGSDHWLNSAYLTWREWIKVRGGIQPILCSRAVGEDEVCFALEHDASSYEPLMPHAPYVSDGEGMPIFDTKCGVPVGENWSILDCFEGVRFVGSGNLFVTNRNLYLKGARDIKIPLGDLQIVATSCSNFLVETRSMDRPLIFTKVNGQKLRDTVYMLLKARTGVSHS